MAVKVGINGFGRIGRNFFRACMGHDDIEIVLANDITDAATLAHLLKHDSTMGVLPDQVEAGDNAVIVNGKSIRITAERDPANLPWKEMGVDVVVESTGLFTKRDDAAKHLAAGAKKVIISAPAKQEDITIVLGVNDDKYDPASHHVISNASCTTNCLAPLAKVMMNNFGIKNGLMTTIHSYTNDQRILDLPHKDLRRSRAAALSMIPTTTGAAKALALVIPELKGKLDGLSIRVPTPNVSIVDLVINTDKSTSVEEVNAVAKAASEGALKGIFEYCDKPLVSKDFNGNPASSIFDAGTTYVVGGTTVKVMSWYDNEWGYSCRVRDLIKFVASKGI
ncbi:MAG: type I glyceraldehyde-3-phosphate dehydrogenase [Nitrospinota bacterium]|nr:type I glyceraldehyde-3-phosphate dehydrogenase [Nitrospinota bacterium]